MEKGIKREGFVTLDAHEVREAVRRYLANLEPPLIGSHVDLYAKGATVQLWQDVVDQVPDMPPTADEAEARRVQAMAKEEPLQPGEFRAPPGCGPVRVGDTIHPETVGAATMVFREESDMGKEARRNAENDEIEMLVGRLMALKRALKNFAKVAPLDRMSCADIQRKLLTIANEEEDNGKGKGKD